MKVTKIVSTNKEIRFYSDEPLTGSAVVCYSPALGENIELARASLIDTGSYAKIDRNIGSDLLFCRFEVLTPDGKTVEGKKYVEEIVDSMRDYDYPTADTKKGLQVARVNDAMELGVKHAALNVNEGDFLLLEPEEGNTIEFDFNGKTYYFNKQIVERNDARVKELSDFGVIITYIVLNAQKWATNVSDEMWDIIKHPNYDGKKDGNGLISQFNVVTDKGIEYYTAFIAFLAERYTREDNKYGRAVGMIIGNEVNSGYTWCNSGLMTCEEYCRHYTKALRLAYQAASVYYKNIRIYISLDHFWTGANFGGDPMRFYPSKSILENVNREFLSEGQVPWNIAHHPYPENLNFPDFWNDKTATDDPDTYRITFKNLEVLAQFLYKEDFLCNGKRRRIILSEQGFNSHWTPESEVVQAMAYGRAYKKIMQIPEIDSFILHAHGDNYQEFGLNLGLWRRKRESGEWDAPKPMYYVFKAIDKKDEKGVYHWERY